MNFPLILLTNDDGIRAPGLRALLQMAMPFGKILIVAPEEAQSAQSHAVTSKIPLRLRQVKDYAPDIETYACTGTPVDCVKIAMSRLLGRMPDVVLSGINHGGNTSTSALYSGTLAAAQEGALYGSIAIAFSLYNCDENADFSHCIKVGQDIIKKSMQNPLNNDAFLSVNIPLNKDIKGVLATRLADGRWREDYEQREDPNGEKYYWLTGFFDNAEPLAEDTDEWALNKGYVSATPIGWDITSRQHLQQVKDYNFSAAP